MELESGTVIAGKYQLESPIARGGMGMVWTARHVKLGSRLAVKFVDPSYAKTPAFVARFEREARATALIESPHVVHVQDFGIEDGTPYIVMELLQGEDLGARLRRLRRLSIVETARVLVQMGHALRRAHEAGIIHRDLKPANLFLARLYEQEVVKVLDFGIAKETAGQVGETTTTGEIVGSPHYMGPEQARADRDIDHRSDLWSVGVLTYRMLTGVLPFPGDVMGAILAKVFVEPPPPVASVATDLPPELDAFFSKALAKKREERFQSIDEVVTAFLEVAARHAELPADVRGGITGSSRASVPAPYSLTMGLQGATSAPSAPNPTASAPAIDAPSPEVASARPPLASVESAATPAPASATFPSISTGIATVHDTATAPPFVPRRRKVWLVAGAALLVVAGGALSLWLGVPSGPPATGSADSMPSTGSPAVAPAPTVIPQGPVSSSAASRLDDGAPGRQTMPGPTASSSASAPSVTMGPQAAPNRGGQSAPSATASNATAAHEATAKVRTPGGAAGKSVPPPPTGKGTKKGDEWGF